jgi:hypothetical protein
MRPTKHDVSSADEDNVEVIGPADVTGPIKACVNGMVKSDYAIR